ncbi:hypothetical protein CAXC1_70013 [Candidatus Xenohaliotis californiensis]|uniref:Uncharacterized protein n=1 Tax=Candidatus Xenohaliotis californiensis TaxID=84677 RepID=A0ABM9N9A5_9RICK|nr:hypothetical protein CAXC1_70013 [Candidatus Xenohaliotis californiensis]
MNRFLIFCLSIVFCLYVYANIGILYPIQIQTAKAVPYMSIQKFFNGEIIGWGVVKKWNGVMKNMIHLKITGTWTDNVGNIIQHIKLDNDENIELDWKIKIDNKNSYTIMAKHCIPRSSGFQHGNISSFSCKTRSMKNGRVGDYTFETMMYLVDKHNMLANTKIKRYGFVIGSVVFNLQHVLTNEKI